jgi:hypothetical protein
MKPILFKGEMVRAILDGRKTQTRRLVKPQPDFVSNDGTPLLKAPVISLESGNFVERFHPKDNPNAWLVKPMNPPYQVGDVLWVRETWMPDGADCLEPMMASGEITPRVLYRANDADALRVGRSFKWRPSIHMPRWAARLFLEVTAVRIERLQGITDADAQAEGVDRPILSHEPGRHPMTGYYRDAFAAYWDALAPAGSKWADNPWVWACEFKQVHP